MAAQEQSVPSKEGKENKMRKIKIEKLVLNVGGTGDKLKKGYILLEKLSGKKPIKVAATKRIPTWHVRPGLEVGVKVTLRGADAEEMLKKILPAINNTIKAKQVQNNFFSFGVHEYIEIPGIEYIREVGIMGFEVTVVFSRAGKRIEKKKANAGKTKRQVVEKEEIKKILSEKFETKIIERRKRE